MRVVVVGAGILGAGCAHELRTQGCDVTVLEVHANGETISLPPDDHLTTSITRLAPCHAAGQQVPSLFELV